MNRALIERNNALVGKLGEENKKYAIKLGSYIRTAGLFYDENEVEDLLYQIFQDIIIAQESGESAEQYFGKKPQETADELIKNLGKMNWKTSLKKLSKIFLTILSGTLILMLSDGNGINVLLIFVFAALGLLVNSGLYFIVHKGVYKKLWDNILISTLIGMGGGIIILVLAFSTFFIIPEIIPQTVVQLSNPAAVFILIMVILIESFVVIRYKELRNIRLAYLPFIWIWGGYGIMMRFPQGQNWIDNNEILLAIVMILGYIYSIIFFVITLLKEKKRQERLSGVRK